MYQLQSLITHQYVILAVEICVTVLIAILVTVFLRSLIRLPKRIGSNKNETYVTILRNGISTLVFVIAAHYILILLNINIAPILASAGIMSIVIGLGARSLVEDFISGIFLYGQATVSLGDYVKIGDIEGYVETIGIRTLSIRSETGALQILPNGMIKGVSNYSRGRAHVYIDIPFKSDQKIDTIIDAMTDALLTLQKDKTIGSRIFPESKVLGIESIKEGGIMLVRVDVVTPTTMRWDASLAFRYMAKKACEKNKVILA